MSKKTDSQMSKKTDAQMSKKINAKMFSKRIHTIDFNNLKLRPDSKLKKCLFPPQPPPPKKNLEELYHDDSRYISKEDMARYEKEYNDMLKKEEEKYYRGLYDNYIQEIELNQPKNDIPLSDTESTDDEDDEEDLEQIDDDF